MSSDMSQGKVRVELIYAPQESHKKKRELHQMSKKIRMK